MRGSKVKKLRKLFNDHFTKCGYKLELKKLVWRRFKKQVQRS